MRKALSSLVLLLALTRTEAAEPFQVEDIRVEGLQRVPIGAVFNYLPIQVGETVDAEQVAEAIRRLYGTGFFQDVTLSRDGAVLVVEVVERPSIGRIDFRGNEQLPTEELSGSLKDVGLAEGLVFNRFLLKDIERELLRIYQARGRYDTRIQSTVSPLPRNRVGIRIEIEEGEPARIQEIRFVGNQAFSDKQLLDVFELGRKRWYHLFSSRDQYSREKLAADLERVRSLYQDAGYINFSITSSQVSVTPDREGIYVTVNVAEGDKYRVEKVELAGELIVPEEQMRALITVEPGTAYSREQVTESVQALRERLGAEGYAFANINVVPEPDAEQRTVALRFFVDPGRRVYVRRINIHGNERTQDQVIRRELRQMEGAWMSTAALQRSRERLQRLGFFDAVDVETPQVPGEPDQVDVNITVAERLSGSIQAGLGYGQNQGMVVNFRLEQDNILGTGDMISLELNNSQVNRVYSISYLDRYYTPSGISRAINLSQRETDARQANLADYDTDTLAGRISFGFPISESDTVYVGASLERLELMPGEQAPSRITDFVARNGDTFENLRLTLSWQRDSRNRSIFPTRGGRQSVALELSVPGSDLEYYKIRYDNRHYFPLSKNITLGLSGSIGYGDSFGSEKGLPFFENFFAGGISSVRGFESNSLGPRDPEDDRSTGGNVRVVGSAELIFPAPGLDLDSVRLTTFIDGGNIYDTHGGGSYETPRFSVGAGIVWLSPLGALTLSLAQPLNDQSGDETEIFQFSLGSFF